MTHHIAPRLKSKAKLAEACAYLEIIMCTFRIKLIKVNIKNPTVMAARMMGSCLSHPLLEETDESPETG